MSTSANQRANMRRMKWGIRNVSMTVVQDSRDLGAHINTIRQVRNNTLAARMKEATQLVRRITFMPVPRTRKRIVINGKAIPKALYGAEVTPVPKNISLNWRQPWSTLSCPRTRQGGPRTSSV